MISPYEILAFLVVAPIIWAGVAIVRRFDTDGSPVEEFEAYCLRERPILFALRPAHDAIDLGRAIESKLGREGRVEHHRGRFPWTRYVLHVRVEVLEGATVVGRIERARLRRLVESDPDIAEVVEGTLRERAVSGLGWFHTELHDGDGARGTARRGHGWACTIDRGSLEGLELTEAPPDWACSGPT